MRVAAVFSGICANLGRGVEAARNGPCELAVGLMDGSLQSHPSFLVAGALLFGAGSLLVLALIALLMLLDSFANLTAIRTQPMPGLLGRLYWDRVSPLLHRPGRRQALRSMLVVLLVFAPAFPRVEVNGWALHTPRAIWNVLRIVSTMRLVGDELAPIRGRVESCIGGGRQTDLLPQTESTDVWRAGLIPFQHVHRTCNGRTVVGPESAG